MNDSLPRSSVPGTPSARAASLGSRSPVPGPPSANEVSLPSRLPSARRASVLFITSIPSPYQVDFFTALQNHGGLDFKVLFCAASEKDRQYSIPKEFSFDGTILPGKRFPFAPKDWHSVRCFESSLEKYLPIDFGVVSGSYFMPAARAARRWFTRNGIPWLYWGESIEKKERHALWQCTKESYLRRFLQPAAGVLGVGNLACATYQRLVGGERPVFNLPYAPDLEPLLKPDADVLCRANQLRSGWAIDDPFVILFCASLTERKAPDALLYAFAQCSRENPELQLLFAGEGPLRSHLVDEAAKLSIAARVRFLGFVEGMEFRAAYHSANLFVLPTRTHEGWGVVVQEALAAGLPVLVSDQVGAGWDLVDATAGRRFSIREPGSLTTCLREMIGDPSLHASAAKRARQECVRDYSSREVAARFVDFLGTLRGGFTA